MRSQPPLAKFLTRLLLSWVLLNAVTSIAMFLPDTMAFVRREEGINSGAQKPTDPHGLVLEGWAQGYMVGSLIVMICITIANMRKGVLLHKLILLELVLGIWHGFWIFFDQPIYGWWLSGSAVPLNISWSIHNVIAWIKIKPFLKKWASWLFIGTVIAAQPYWVVEIYANFAFFHGINDLFLRTRPWEALCRDPWWIFTTVALIYNIKVRYDLSIWEVIRISPRFGVMLGAMFLSIIFIIIDICSVTQAFQSILPVGINPFWKLAFVFKCLTDTVILDDFKTALDRLRAFKMARINTYSLSSVDHRTRATGTGTMTDTEPIGVEPIGTEHAQNLQDQWNQALDSIESGKEKSSTEANPATARHLGDRGGPGGSAFAYAWATDPSRRGQERDIEQRVGQVIPDTDSLRTDSVTAYSPPTGQQRSAGASSADPSTRGKERGIQQQVGQAIPDMDSERTDGFLAGGPPPEQSHSAGASSTAADRTPNPNVISVSQSWDVRTEPHTGEKDASSRAPGA
ncbi:hypothetical protein P152DRAFT_279732 [Eremomyces bilateralis CBS 781.70]|uniref:Uncharacterized protein n=1 Tax=Eremomyces bilateralis CBS 781.70 TaxID=1392243 RepID=A0A6G1G9N5_9PEZI|nr:uncharacterized protein P152DRAFT_279732 [Eremomyces bilateralis CBS 781.70]KAF1814579.1 hypothetical protein P152DRAFT_279732 [Eremomyces bilateralis CBS 781.70]